MRNIPSQQKIRKILEKSETNLNVNEQKDFKIEFKLNCHKNNYYLLKLKKQSNFSLYKFHFNLK